jgi:hypothetical protein
MPYPVGAGADNEHEQIDLPTFVVTHW